MLHPVVKYVKGIVDILEVFWHKDALPGKGGKPSRAKRRYETKDT
jgi:hypothetical protein